VDPAGTRVRILNTKDKVIWIKFTAPTANSGLTYVGDSAVSATNGYVLGAAGGADATVELNFSPGSITMDTFYIDAASTGDNVSWIGIFR
jgi:hypothetical protein